MKGFMDFLKQTNALALAVGVIIGGAVGKVVSSLAGDILMPLISLALPAGDWRVAKIALSHKPDGTIDKALALGSFGGAIVDFIIIAFVVYMITRNMMKPAPAAPAPATKTCPECTEAVPVAAKRCKFCGSAL